MKQIIKGMMFSALLLGFSSCSKDDSDNAPSPTGGTMTAKVDGVNWTAKSGGASATIINNVTNITGIASDSSMITITINQAIAQNGTYGLDMPSGNAGAYNTSYNGSTIAWTSNSNPTNTGSITITKLDQTNKKISGTFNFKAWKAIDNTFRTITSGTFTDLTYATSVSGGGNNSFTVKIDNVTFTPALIAGTKTMGNIMLTASDNQGSKSVGITMPDNITPGTYSLSAFGTQSGQYNPNSSTYTMSSSGSLVITSHNTSTKKVIGTFNFVSEPITGGPPTYNLTNGSFTVTYQ